MIFKKKIAFLDAFRQGLDRAGLGVFSKLRVMSILIVRVDLQREVIRTLASLAEQDAVAVEVGPYIDLDKLEQFLELIVKYLPLLLEILLPLFGLQQSE